MNSGTELILARIKERFKNRGINVLIADDEDFIRDLLSNALTQCGFSCFETTSALGATITFRAQPDFDLVILDDRMPPLDGKEALRQILEINPAAKVIMCTTAVRETCFDGAVAQIDKPFRLVPFLHIIEDVL